MAKSDSFEYNNMQIDRIRAEKAELRREIQEKLKGQSPFSRNEHSRVIQEKLISSAEFRNARTVMSYIAFPTEVDTCYLNEKALESGKRLAVPYVDVGSRSVVAVELRSLNDLVKGPLGIYGPREGTHNRIPLEEIDLVVVPGIAFDKKNKRLGRGKGYYDAFLAEKELSSAFTVGFAFSFQVVDSLPTDRHDMSVSAVITD